MNIHVRAKDPKNKTINCVFHFTVPDANNYVGVPWNEAIQKEMLPSPMMADNDSTENAQITAGTVLEVPIVVRFSSTSLTSAERVAEIQAEYEAVESSVFSDLAAKLDYFGKTL